MTIIVEGEITHSRINKLDHLNLIYKAQVKISSNTHGYNEKLRKYMKSVMSTGGEAEKHSALQLPAW